MKKKAALKLGAESAMVRKRKSSVEMPQSITKQGQGTLSLPSGPPAKKRRKSGKADGDERWKKERMYCICKTAYDESK